MNRPKIIFFIFALFIKIQNVRANVCEEVSMCFLICIFSIAFGLPVAIWGIRKTLEFNARRKATI